MRPKFDLNPLQHGWKPLLWTLVMLVGGLALTGYSVYVTRHRLHDDAWLQFSQQFDRLEVSIQAQFNQPLYGIRGAIGAQASTDAMRRANFRAYVASRDVATEFPGIRGFGYIERVMRTDLERFEKLEKADGAPDFAVNTRGDAADLYVIKYVEPLASNRAAQGLDVGADPIRREAVERAIDTGEPSLTGTIALAQDGRKGPGFLYLIPAFRGGVTPDTPQARRAQLMGLFYSPLVMNELLLRSVAVTNGMIDFEISDGISASPQTLVFSSKKTLDASSGAVTPTDFATERAFHNFRTLPIGGRLLMLRAGSSAVFESQLDRTTPWLVGVGGTALSLLLATIAWLLLIGRVRAETLARSMTTDLGRLVETQRTTNEELGKAVRESQALMEAIDQHSIVSIADPAGNIIYVNDMFCSISGYSREELNGQNHRVVKSHTQSNEFWAAMWKTISSGYTWRDVVCNRGKDGSLYWVDTSVSPFFDANGAIEKYVSIRTDVTAARLAQESLAYERERLSNIILGTRSATWEWNVQTKEVLINERWAEIIGYTLQELGPISAQTWVDHCHPDDLRASNRQLGQLLRGELDYYDFEMRMRHRDGHWVWVHAMGDIASRTADGQPDWLSGTHVDISEQKLSEERLHRNNTVMQSILDNVPVGLSAFDSELHLIAKNRRFQEVLDFPDALFSGPTTTFESIIRFNADRGEYGQGDHEQTIRTIVERARHPELHQFERVRPNGVALEVRGAPLPDGGFVTTYANISQRKRAEAEIARTTAMLQSVLDAASEVAVITTGLDRTITLFNKGAERMLGYRADEVVGLHTSALFLDAKELEARGAALSAELGRPVAAMATVIDESHLGRKSEWTFVRKDGSTLQVALVVTALTDANGARTGYLGISHDISIEKDYENWLRAAMEEAKAATVAKSQFLANMSHEIRTPMNAILGMLTLLQNTELSPRQLDYATKSEGAAKSLLGLLNDILDFSKMDAGKMTLDPQRFRLDRLMRDLSVILSASVGKKPVEVLFDIDPAVPKALIGDSMRLQQVLINLAGNAIKFTAQGEVVVQIKVLARTGADTTLRISVRDSGIGIAPENQKHIFEGFSQAEASTTRRFGGTGLGLSISRRLVELMGGELGLESVLGQGSTFHFTMTLPAADQAADVLEMSTARLLTSLNVLVVDDNPVAREVLVAMAQSWGWQVDAAGSGAEALRLVEARASVAQAPYQAVFVDWQMPEMDGWETSMRIRELAPAAAAPIMVMVTAHGREMLSQRTADEQARLNGFLVKPVTASMLFDAVANAAAGNTNLRARARAKTVRQHRLEGMRLLVVEDNLINQQVAQELLSAEGARVELADNGQLGVSAVAGAEPQFDAVLMDLQMPVMDGYSATRAIRHELGLLHLPIIAMTANAMASDREACLAAGMNDHVGKPIDLPHLIRVLQNHVRRTASATAPPALPMTADTTLPGAVAKSPAATLPAADAVDVNGALQRLGDNTDLYTRILQSYLEEIPTLPDQLDAFLLAGDLAGAGRLLHTLKGLSATVGADYLAAVAKAAESAVKDADAIFPHAELRASFREAVASTGRIMSQIARGLARTAPQRPHPSADLALDNALLVTDLRELQGLLKSSDMRALDAHVQLHQTHAHGAPDAFKELDLALAALDFAQGVVQCETLMRKFSPST